MANLNCASVQAFQCVVFMKISALTVPKTDLLSACTLKLYLS